MSDQARRHAFTLPAGITALAFAADSSHLALGLNDGSVHRLDLASDAPQPHAQPGRHGGAVLSLAFDRAGGLISGAEDGLVQRHWDGTATPLARHPHQWIEPMLALSDGRVAYAVGRALHVIDPATHSPALSLGDHPSTITALARRGPLLAATHYNGVTLWDMASDSPTPRRLEWKGSHLAVALSPDGSVVATSTQEGDVHAWRLTDGREMRMAGYPGKVRSLDWSCDGLLLVTSGVEQLVAWLFDGAGPEGRAPRELANGGTAQVLLVAANPKVPMIAAGLESGTLLLADAASGQVGKFPVSKRAPITQVGFSPDGVHLLAGTEDGKAVLFTSPAVREAA